MRLRCATRAVPLGAADGAWYVLNGYNRLILPADDRAGAVGACWTRTARRGPPGAGERGVRLGTARHRPGHEADADPTGRPPLDRQVVHIGFGLAALGLAE